MVLTTQVLGYVKKVNFNKVKAPRKYLRSSFIDSFSLVVKGGSGGTGLPRYGGKGGAGGDVYVVSKEGVTLKDVSDQFKEKKKVIADHGEHSSLRGIIGKPGAHYYLNVPPGITVYSRNGIKIGELNKDASELLVAKGGVGGCEETGFCGTKGEQKLIVLDLKLIADVGLVGFPNAGKSTFLSVMSKAKPKIASYPFTTIRPKLGIIHYKDYRQITVADLPGLIEGAHINIGMGHKFLKHVERTKLLLFIVDIQGFCLSHKYKSRSCLETIILLNKELELYKPELVDRPAMLIINKMDTENAYDIYNEIKPKLKNLANCINEFPDYMQPETVIDFKDIMITSLLKPDKDAIQMIKKKIRDILDKIEEKKLLSEPGNSEGEVLEKIKQQTRRHAPALI